MNFYTKLCIMILSMINLPTLYASDYEIATLNRHKELAKNKAKSAHAKENSFYILHYLPIIALIAKNNNHLGSAEKLLEKQLHHVRTEYKNALSQKVADDLNLAKENQDVIQAIEDNQDILKNTTNKRIESFAHKYCENLELIEKVFGRR